MPLPVTFFGITYGFPMETAELRIAAIADDGTMATLARVPVSRYAPEVVLDRPVPAADNQLHVSWRGSDVDGDALSYTVAVSPDHGRNWWPVAYKLSEPGYVMDTGDLQVGRYHMMVIVSDGVRTRRSELQPFAVRY